MLSLTILEGDFGQRIASLFQGFAKDFLSRLRFFGRDFGVCAVGKAQVQHPGAVLQPMRAIAHKTVRAVFGGSRVRK